MFLTSVAGVPVACVVAVLKYRLYDLGRIVSRTVTYAIVTGLLVGIYAGLVLLATEVLTIKSPVAVAGATLAFAARLTEELDADAVTEDLARSVHAALQPAHVSVWLSERRLACASCASSTSSARSAEPPGLDPAQLVEHNSYVNPSGLSGFGVVNTPAPESWWTPHTRACNAYQGCPRCLCPTRGGLHDG